MPPKRALLGVVGRGRVAAEGALLCLIAAIAIGLVAQAARLCLQRGRCLKRGRVRGGRGGRQPAAAVCVSVVGHRHEAYMLRSPSSISLDLALMHPGGALEGGGERGGGDDGGGGRLPRGRHEPCGDVGGRRAEGTGRAAGEGGSIGHRQGRGALRVGGRAPPLRSWRRDGGQPVLDEARIGDVQLLLEMHHLRLELLDLIPQLSDPASQSTQSQRHGPPTYPPTYLPTFQSTNQPTNQPTNLPTYPPAHSPGRSTAPEGRA